MEPALGIASFARTFEPDEGDVTAQLGSGGGPALVCLLEGSLLLVETEDTDVLAGEGGPDDTSPRSALSSQLLYGGEQRRTHFSLAFSRRRFFEYAHGR